jgi:hypothetical protein
LAAEQGDHSPSPPAEFCGRGRSPWWTKKGTTDRPMLALDDVGWLPRVPLRRDMDEERRQANQSLHLDCLH